MNKRHGHVISREGSSFISNYRYSNKKGVVGRSAAGGKCLHWLPGEKYPPSMLLGNNNNNRVDVESNKSPQV